MLISRIFVKLWYATDFGGWQHSTRLRADGKSIENIRCAAQNIRQTIEKISLDTSAFFWCLFRKWWKKSSSMLSYELFTTFQVKPCIFNTLRNSIGKIIIYQLRWKRFLNDNTFDSITNSQCEVRYNILSVFFISLHLHQTIYAHQNWVTSHEQLWKEKLKYTYIHFEAKVCIIFFLYTLWWLYVYVNASSHFLLVRSVDLFFFSSILTVAITTATSYVYSMYKLQVYWITFIIYWNIIVHKWMKRVKEQRERSKASRKMKKIDAKESVFLLVTAATVVVVVIVVVVSFDFSILFHLPCREATRFNGMPINIHFFRSQISRSNQHTIRATNIQTKYYRLIAIKFYFIAMKNVACKWVRFASFLSICEQKDQSLCTMHIFIQSFSRMHYVFNVLHATNQNCNWSLQDKQTDNDS